MGEEGVVETGKGTAAETDDADSAGGVTVGQGNVGAMEFFLEGHFGDKRDTHPGGDHAEEAAELATFENDLWVQSSAIAGGQRIFAEAMAVAEEEEGFGAKLFQSQRATAGQRVLMRQSGEDGLGEDGEGFEFVAPDGESKEGEVDRGGAKTVEEDGCDLFNDGDFSFGKFWRKFREVQREEIRSDGRNDAYGDGTAHRVFLLSEIAAGSFEFMENGAGAREKGLADFGETDRAAETVEETGSELVFELTNLL